MTARSLDNAHYVVEIAVDWLGVMAIALAITAVFLVWRVLKRRKK